MKDQYGCEAKAQYLFRNNFIFEVKEPNIPNAFTPNGDGINDEFYVEIKGATYFRIYILNANSQIVFESSNPDERWNGHDKHRGNEIHPGFYTCIIEYALAGGEIKKDQRNVQLLKE